MPADERAAFEKEMGEICPDLRALLDGHTKSGCISAMALLAAEVLLCDQGVDVALRDAQSMHAGVYANILRLADVGSGIN